MTVPTVIKPEDVYSRIESLGYEVQPNDVGRIDYLIALISEKVKLNTHCSEVPCELYNTVVGMVAGEFLAGKLAIGGLDESIIGAAVKRISEGDTTVEYAVGVVGGDKTPAERFKAYIDALRSPPDWVFASVRRIRWH